VGNNPLKYIDPTGHVKKIPKEMGLIQEKIFQLDIFKRLGAINAHSLQLATLYV
jgi:hypothetical protein